MPGTTTDVTLMTIFRTSPTNQPERTGPPTDAPKNGPIFTRKSVQPPYNQKTRYLPIPRKCWLCKLFAISALQKAQKM